MPGRSAVVENSPAVRRLPDPGPGMDRAPAAEDGPSRCGGRGAGSPPPASDAGLEPVRRLPPGRPEPTRTRGDLRPRDRSRGDGPRAASCADRVAPAPDAEPIRGRRPAPCRPGTRRRTRADPRPTPDRTDPRPQGRTDPRPQGRSRVGPARDAGRANRPSGHGSSGRRSDRTRPRSGADGSPRRAARGEPPGSRPRALTSRCSSRPAAIKGFPRISAVRFRGVCGAARPIPAAEPAEPGVRAATLPSGRGDEAGVPTEDGACH